MRNVPSLNLGALNKGVGGGLNMQAKGDQAQQSLD